jgi:hypothetical protein
MDTHFAQNSILSARNAVLGAPNEENNSLALSKQGKHHP